MARADLLIDLVRSGSKGDKEMFKKALEALVADERMKQHHALADQLASHLTNGSRHQSVDRLPQVNPAQASSPFIERIPERALHDLILPSPVNEALKELVEEQHRADVLRSNGLEPRNRLLLVGPPGNGKTSLAEALAYELAAPFLVVRYESIIASYLGETAVRVAQLFEQVRSRRCVLFFDEFDVVGKERGDVHETGEIKRVVSSLLLQVDALPSHVVVVAATNHPELLDRAVWRRFQLRLDLPMPTTAQIAEWFRRLELRLGAKRKIDTGPRARRLRGASFSDLEQFTLDVKRRLVLEEPGADPNRIINDRLQQWETRMQVRPRRSSKE